MVDLKKFSNFYGAKGATRDALEYLKNGDYIDLPLAECLTGRADLEDKIYAQSHDVYEIIGNTGLHITVQRDDKFSQYQFMGACEAKDNRNRCADFRRRVYVCSPFRGMTKQEQAFHVWFAAQIGREILDRGNVPVIPHLYYPQLLDDSKPEERELALELGKRLLETCDCMQICRLGLDVSEGMRDEAEYAANYLDVEIFDEMYPLKFWSDKYRTETSRAAGNGE